MKRRTTEIRQTTGGHRGFAGVAGPNRGSTRMTTTRMTTTRMTTTRMTTRIHARRASVPRHRGVGGVGGHGLRHWPSLHLPWAPRACRSASLRHGRARVNGAACRRRSEAVRRRLRQWWTARGQVRRPRRLPRGRHPPRPGGVRGRHGVHVGGGADVPRRRPDRSSPPDAHRCPRRRCDSPTILRRRYGRCDGSRESPRRDGRREPPRHRRWGRMSLGSRRSAQRLGDRRRPHSAAPHGHPRGAPGPGHRGGHDDADGRDGRRPPRLRLRLREIRRSRCGVRQMARQRGRAALHRGGAAVGRHRDCVVAALRRGGAAVDRRRVVVAAVRTVRPRRRPCVGDCHRGFRGRQTAPCLWPRLSPPVPTPAAARGEEQGVGRAEAQPIRSRPVRWQDHPSCPSAAAVATWGVAAASPAALAAAAAAEWPGGKARWRASRRAIRRARPRDRGNRGPT